MLRPGGFAGAQEPDRRGRLELTPAPGAPTDFRACCGEGRPPRSQVPARVRDAAPLEPLYGALRLDRLGQIAALAQQARLVIVLLFLGTHLQDVPADPGDERQQDHETLPPDE